MYKIKTVPEDFFVKEIPSYKESQDGAYAYFWMKKKDYNTIDAVKKIAVMLHIPIKNIGYAGNKDKSAVTEQAISIRAIRKEKVSALKLRDISLDYLCQGEYPINLGDLRGNYFRIVVRDLPNMRISLKDPEKILNLYGPQRFSKNNADIGKNIVKKNFSKAAELIDRKDVKEHLMENPGDPVGAFRKIPLRLRKIYIHSYQSLIWNNTAKKYLAEYPSAEENIPIVGFGTPLKNDRISMIIRKILAAEDITTRDFIIPQMPELSSEGSYRKIFVKAENLDLKPEKDDINKNRQKATVQFFLPKGSYATVVIDYLFSR